MNKQPNHRFNIWNLSDNGTIVPGEPDSRQRRDGHPSVRGRSKQVRGAKPVYDDLDGAASPLTTLSDLAMLESLYAYGPAVEIELRGKCTTQNGRSIGCKTTEVSKDAVRFAYDADSVGDPAKRCDDLQAGTPMHVDLDQLGAFEGVLAAQYLEGFQIAVDHDCKSMLSTKLAGLAGARGISFDQTAVPVREHITRIEPDNKNCAFIDQKGVLRKGRLINVSQVDALITASILPPVAAHIVFNGPRRYLAEVTRTFEIGFAVRFCPPIPREEFSPAIKLSDK